MHSIQNGKLADIHTCKGFFSIEKMTWSDDGRRLAFLDSSKKVFVVSIRATADKSVPVIETESETPMKSTAKGPILQLLFCNSSDRLFVHSSSAIHIVSIMSPSVLHSLDLDVNELKWLQSNEDSGPLFGFGVEAMVILDAELAQIQTYRYDLSASPFCSTADTRVDCALLSSDKRHVLVQMRSQWGRFFYCFQITSFSVTSEQAASHKLEDESAPSMITPSFLPQDISSQISTALSFMSHNRLTYLSRDFSVCSWQFLHT